MNITPENRRVFMAPTAGRAYFSRKAAYNNEAKARLYTYCECSEDESVDIGVGFMVIPGTGDTCRLHSPGYTECRESDDTSKVGRIIRRWARLLAAQDRRERAR